MLETEVLPKPNLEKVPEEYDPYQCTLSSKFKDIAIEDLREDDTIKSQALAQMREWIAKHPHIKKCRTGKLSLSRLPDIGSVTSSFQMLCSFFASCARKSSPFPLPAKSSNDT